MAITTFAAIDLGSYEVSMKVFEISKKAGLREVDYIRYRMDLGKDTYSQRHLGGERLQELCKVLEGSGRLWKDIGYRITVSVPPVPSGSWRIPVSPWNRFTAARE